MSLCKQRFHTFLNNMLMELIHCWQRRSTEIILIESAFLITKKYCEFITQECWQRNFESTEEEIYFFKKIHPHFCGRLMYYSILYEAMVSVPTDPVAGLDYWKQESERLQRFVNKNSGFIEYIDNGNDHRDEAYFLRGDYLQPSFVHGKIYQCGPDDATLQSSLLCSLFAERSYNFYVQAKRHK